MNISRAIYFLILINTSISYSSDLHYNDPKSLPVEVITKICEYLPGDNIFLNEMARITRLSNYSYFKIVKSYIEKTQLVYICEEEIKCLLKKNFKTIVSKFGENILMEAFKVYLLFHPEIEYKYHLKNQDLDKLEACYYRILKNRGLELYVPVKIRSLLLRLDRGNSLDKNITHLAERFLLEIDKKIKSFRGYTSAAIKAIFINFKDTLNNKEEFSNKIEDIRIRLLELEKLYICIDDYDRNLSSFVKIFMCFSIARKLPELYDLLDLVGNSLANQQVLYKLFLAVYSLKYKEEIDS